MRRFAVFLFVTFVFLPGPGGAEDDPVKKLADIYDSVAFFSEERTGAHPLDRWEEPIRIRLTGPGAERWQATVDEIGRWIADHTGLSVETRTGWFGANLTVSLFETSRESAMAAREDGVHASLTSSKNGNPCFGYYWWEGNQIYQARTFIPVDISVAGTQNCLWEEALQVLGLPNDYCVGEWTLFCEGTNPPKATALDALLVRIHYDRRLRPGMTRAEAKPIVETIIREHLAAGVAWR